MYCRNPQCRALLDRRRTYFYCPRCGWTTPRWETNRAVRAVSRTVWNIMRKQWGVPSTTGERYFRQARQALRRRHRVEHMNVAPFRPVNYGKAHPGDIAILRKIVLGFLLAAAFITAIVGIYMALNN